jgi:hypothetical protein
MKKLLLVFLGLLFLFTNQAISQTNVSGNITGNTTWTKANSPYLLTGTVGVPAAYQLTIEPGVVVQRTGDFQILINGAVSIQGSATDSIVFSSGAALGISN